MESNVEAADSAKQPETESSEPTELEEIKADELLKETVNTDEYNRQRKSSLSRISQASGRLFWRELLCGVCRNKSR